MHLDDCECEGGFDDPVYSDDEDEELTEESIQRMEDDLLQEEEEAYGMDFDHPYPPRHAKRPANNRPAPYTGTSSETPTPRTPKKKLNNKEYEPPIQPMQHAPVEGFHSWQQSIGVITQTPDTPTTYIKGRTVHGGFDIANVIGTPITALSGGTVESVSGSNTDKTGWGLNIIIRDAFGWSHRYAHLNAVHVNIRSMVEPGDLIGEMGHSGFVMGKTGVHLHYEVKDAIGNLLDPSNNYLPIV